MAADKENIVRKDHHSPQNRGRLNQRNHQTAVHHIGKDNPINQPEGKVITEEGAQQIVPPPQAPESSYHCE